MPKKQISRLFAVVALTATPAVSIAGPRTLANGSPACGNTMSKSSSSRCVITASADPWDTPDEEVAVEAETPAPSSNVDVARMTRMIEQLLARLGDRTS